MTEASRSVPTNSAITTCWLADGYDAAGYATVLTIESSVDRPEAVRICHNCSAANNL